MGLATGKKGRDLPPSAARNDCRLDLFIDSSVQPVPGLATGKGFGCLQAESARVAVMTSAVIVEALDPVCTVGGGQGSAPLLKTLCTRLCHSYRGRLFFVVVVGGPLVLAIAGFPPLSHR